ITDDPEIHVAEQECKADHDTGYDRDQPGNVARQGIDNSLQNGLCTSKTLRSSRVHEHDREEDGHQRYREEAQGSSVCHSKDSLAYLEKIRSERDRSRL